MNSIDHSVSSQPRAAAGPVTLSERDRKRLESYIARRCRNNSDVDDVLQETQMRLIDAGQKSDIAAPLAYAFRIADSIILKEARLASRLGEMPALEPESDLPGPEQRVDYQQRMATFRAALEGMPKLRRTVFVKRHLGDLSRAEIAKELGISVESVKKHLVRARQELAKVSVDIELSPPVRSGSAAKGAA